MKFGPLTVQPSDNPIADYEAAYRNMTDALEAAMRAMADLHLARDEAEFHAGRIAKPAPAPAPTEIP